MITQAENEKLTRVGPDNPMGRLFRRYWIPAALSAELPEPDGAPLRVRLLGEDLIAFRDSEGKVGLVDPLCPHRLAPLFFGRNEASGLRCIYHGWKFNREGDCVAMPTEPPESTYKTKVRIKAYPTWEGGGILWTYMGPPELQPAYPDHELVRAPATHRLASKTLQECNFLQALEGGVDPTHATILHNEKIGDLSFLGDFHRIVAALEIEETEYGIFYAALRDVDAGKKKWIRGYHWIMPAYHMRGTVESTFWLYQKHAPTIDGHIWVPIDDTATWVYNFMYSHDPARPLTDAQIHDDEAWMGRAPEDMAPDLRAKRNMANDYLIDRKLQKTTNFSGITGINTQDFAVQDGMGAIKDRTREHLGSSDRVVILMRKIFLEEMARMERGESLRGLDPALYRGVRPLDHEVVADKPWRAQLEKDLLARF